ncbi:glutamate receptor ionotropic, delta-1-like [Palaemon carinicauda]|uniref:glutamate receptor ionotropic, delta-1-like n=1 Tax=Palaemon carinicauda TaxID=392227 RepID=UPI0035B67E93
MNHQHLPFIILLITGSVICLHPEDMGAKLNDKKQGDRVYPTKNERIRQDHAFKLPQHESLDQLNDNNQRFNFEINHSSEDSVFSASSVIKRKDFIKKQRAKFKIPFDLMYLEEMNETLLPCSPAATGLDSEVTAAVADAIRTVIVTHLHLVFMSEPDICLLNMLWAKGIVLELLDTHSWWIRLFDIDYQSHTQHVLVGSLEWIVVTMEKVKLLYNNSSMNAFNTRWIWVPSFVESDESVSTPWPSRKVSFSNVLNELTSSLQEGMRGIVVFSDRKPSHLYPYETTNASLIKRYVKIGSITAPGDGSWTLKTSSSWFHGNFNILRPLWPRPSFDLQNRTIRITCLQKPTVFEYKEGGGLDEAVGYANDLMLIARRHLNFTDVLVPIDGFGNKDSNGNWNGMVGVLHRKEADIAPLDFTPSYDRSEVVEFGYPVGEDIVLILSKAPAEITKPFLLLQIFSLEVWACIFASALSLGIALEILVKIESILSHKSSWKTWTTRQIGNSLKIFLYQGSTHWPLGAGGRIAASSGLLIALVVGSLYIGSITAFFAIPFRSKPIDTVEELLRSSVRLAIRSKTNTYSTMVQEEDGILHKGRDRVGLFSGTEINTWEFFRIIADGTYALVDVYSSAVGSANSFEKRNEKCKFYISKEAVRTDADVFAFMKNSPIFYQFDKTMQWLRYFGIIEHTKRRYYSVACEVRVSSGGIRPMSVIQVQGSFYVLGIGLFFGFVIFLVEVIWPNAP